MRPIFAVATALSLACAPPALPANAGAPSPADPINELAARPASALDVMLLYAQQAIKNWSIGHDAPLEMRTLRATLGPTSANANSLFIAATFYPLRKALPSGENCAQAAYWLLKQFLPLEPTQLPAANPGTFMAQQFFMTPVQVGQDSDKKLAAALGPLVYLDIQVLENPDNYASFWDLAMNGKVVHCRLHLATDSLEIVPVPSIGSAPH